MLLWAAGGDFYLDKNSLKKTSKALYMMNMQ